MKIKKIMLVSLLLLAVLTISAVSAADNLTEVNEDVLQDTSSEEMGLSKDINESVISSSEDEILKTDDGSFTALQNKINEASEGSTITLENDYAYDDGFSTDGIKINKSLTIDGKGYTIDGKSQSRIFHLSSKNIALKNITFVNCSANDDGGAIYNDGPNCSVGSCSFVNCSAKIDGGAIYNEGSNCSVGSCSFVNCSAKIDGGAIYNYRVNCTVDYCNFNNCFVLNCIITHCTFTNCLKISYPKTIYANKETEIIFTGLHQFEDQIKVTVNGKTYTADYSFGEAAVSFKSSKTGINTISYRFDSINDSGKFNITVVLKNPVITASNFKKNYLSAKKYQVRVKGTDGKYVGAGKTVKFIFYETQKSLPEYTGKKIATKTAKTDKNGYIKANFNIKPGYYKVKIKYGTTTVTKYYEVNSIIKINSVYKKNSQKVSVTSKTIKFSATLKKVDGKILKGKKVKFTIYNILEHGPKKIKSYTAKTNSKGIASITFKKSPVKLGSSYIVYITYLKDINYASFSLYSKSPFNYYFIGH